MRSSRKSTTSKSVATAPMMSATATSASMSYDEVNKLAFRALQSQCKQLGLSAVGTTAALRGRLLDHFGLSREIALKKEAPAASAAEIEVRKALAPFFFNVSHNIYLTLPFILSCFVRNSAPQKVSLSVTNPIPILTSKHF